MTVEGRYADADRLLRETALPCSRIGDMVGLPRRRVQEYAKLHNLRIKPPAKKKRNGLAKQAEHRDMRERSALERQHMAKIAKKVVDLYVNHGVETPFLIERFGFSSETICKFLRAAGVREAAPKLSDKTGPPLANQ